MVAKLGVLLPRGDIEELDEGFAGELAFGTVIVPLLSIEGSVGYLNTDGQFGASKISLWSLPVFGGVRLNLPFVLLEPYVGAGIGGVYSDYEIGALHGSGWDFAWTGYAGLGLDLGKVSVGAELKYLQTSDTENDFAIEGLAAFLFFSLPF
jgi:opacity protein-like surface antigen